MGDNESNGSIKKLHKAVVILSGGIDSAIAAQIVSDFGIEMIGLSFPSPFCVCNTKSHSFECAAIYFAEKIDLSYEMVAKTDEYLNIIKDPKYTELGKDNPCIDCKIYVFKKAKEFMQKIGAEFIVTGEILGSKPKQATIDLILKIDKLADVEGLVLRPFSVAVFPETIPERNGWVDRSVLLGLQGKKANVKYNPGSRFSSIRNFCASGGCLLIDKKYSKPILEYVKGCDDPKINSDEILSVGQEYHNKKSKFKK